MAQRFLNKKTRGFYFVSEDGESNSYVLIFGDEVTTLPGVASGGVNFRRVEYRGRQGDPAPNRLEEFQCQVVAAEMKVTRRS